MRPLKNADALVSILVFLEWPLGLTAIDGAKADVKKFQSLFFWNGLWDGKARPVRSLYYGVSILVFLEWPLGQSNESRVRHRCFVCFNPCFSGMAFGTLVVLLECAEILRFQSLFFWNGLWDSDNDITYLYGE